MQLSAWLAAAQKQLEAAGIATARLDTLVLLEDAANKPRAWLLAHPDYELPDELIDRLASQLKRRAKHNPLAYIRQKIEFYGREFYVTEAVLVPRPESETMIELLKKLAPGIIPKIDSSADSRTVTLMDVGTGSGALAVTAALELPGLQVHACDLDPQALEVARKNAHQHKVVITFSAADLLSSPTQNLDIILANLPYVPDSHAINAAAMQEPAMAIFGGPDGLDLYRRMFTQAASMPEPPQLILTESLPPQHNSLVTIAADLGYQLTDQEDFILAFSHRKH